MKMKRKICLFLLVFSSACVTVNIYFPAAAVQQAADKIVEETWGGAEGSTGKKEQSKTESFVTRMAYGSPIMVTEAFAQEADINISNPAVRALKDSIKTRSSSFVPFMDRGNIGINKEGFLEVRNSKGLSLRERAEVNQLVEAENRDREALYTEIAKANNFPREKVADIRRIFAKSWRDQARAGWWIQNDQGNWVMR